ncbi:MAG: 50S ribosomal protein L25 [Thermoleophilia bacterium]|nr:50S ribosomal protein L25 [Thermoleophilia bacterium]
MKQANLTVRERNSFGSPEARRMRRQGQIPGVLYGGGNSGISLSVDEKALRQALGRGRRTQILNLKFEGQKDKSQLAMLKEYQSDPITGDLLHLDFIEVRMDRPIDSSVYVELVGQAAGTRDGGIMDHALREVHIRSLPRDIPEVIQCGVEELNIGDSVRVSDLKAPPGVEILDDPETLVAAVMAPKLAIEEEIVEEEVEAAAEEGEAPEAEEKPAEPEGGESE